jgi:hypothetical protein
MAVIEVLLMYGADVTRVMAQGIPQPCWRNSRGAPLRWTVLRG